MTFHTKLTTAQLEARDTTIHPLALRTRVSDFDDIYAVGDSLTVTSRNGDIFIGHIEDIDEPEREPRRFYVELD